jgi:hypothetical protein
MQLQRMTCKLSRDVAEAVAESQALINQAFHKSSAMGLVPAVSI